MRSDAPTCAATRGGGDDEVVRALGPAERGRHPVDPGAGLAAMAAGGQGDGQGRAVQQATADAAERHVPEGARRRTTPTMIILAPCSLGRLDQPGRRGAGTVDHQPAP